MAKSSTANIAAQIEEARAAFVSVGSAVDAILEPALVKAALRVERDAKKNAPVDTGRLRASITHRVVRSNSKASAEVGTNVSYAAAQEFGASYKSGRKMAGVFYLTRAIESNRAAIMELLATEIGQAIDDAASR